MTRRFKLGSTHPPAQYTPGVHVIRATNHTHRTMPLDVRPSAERGREAWAKLHSERRGSIAFVQKWMNLIPGSCKCRKDAIQLLRDCPPRYDDEEAWFAWTVEFHNLVNAKLIGEGDTTKRIITLEEAYAIWRSVPT